MEERQRMKTSWSRGFMKSEDQMLVGPVEGLVASYRKRWGVQQENATIKHTPRAGESRLGKGCFDSWDLDLLTKGDILRLSKNLGYGHSAGGPVKKQTRSGRGGGKIEEEDVK